MAHVFHRLAKPKHFIQSAIKHPGRMKRGAERAGMSLKAYEHKEAHSPNKSLAAAARLGLRFGKGGDLHK